MVAVAPMAKEGADPTSGAQSSELGGHDTGKTNGASGAGAPSLAILREVRGAQSAHGLKQRVDYLQYRRYCARRLARVRRATSNTNGRGRYIATPITAASVAKDARTLLVPLYCAERAWAYAMDVKRAPSAGPARARRTVVARLTKAAAHASELRALCITSGTDADTCLEAEAYARWMCATLALEREQWRAALADFEQAHVVYGGLAGVRAGTAAAGVFEERVDEIAQALRFCRYNLARDGGDDADSGDADLFGMMREAGGLDDVLAEKIEGALAAARKRAALSFGEVTWCGRTIALRSEVVREAVLAATQESVALRALDTREADDYDKVFIAYHDASRVVQREIAQFRQETAARAEERINELELLAAYLAHGRLTHTIERNKLLVAAHARRRGARPDDLARLYDTLVHNATDMLALRGVADDASAAARADAQRALFRAHYCLHLARCYVSADMHGAAELLFERAAVHASPLTRGEHAEDAASLLRDAAGMRVRARAQLFLRDARIAERFDKLDIGAKRSMCDSKEFVSFAKQKGVRRIAQIPPALEAVPCKPVLFDLALDGVRFPGEGEERKIVADQKIPVAATTAATPENETTGALGAMQSTRLGRWWSGKG